jgi:succinate dehydrogenase hydrophobic anchor subunit
MTGNLQVLLLAKHGSDACRHGNAHVLRRFATAAAPACMTHAHLAACCSSASRRAAVWVYCRQAMRAPMPYATMSNPAPM